MNPAWEGIRISVCRRCMDGDATGACHLPEEDPCPLASSFPLVVEVILKEHGRPADVIAEALRARVCPRCSAGNARECRQRDALACALERYMPQIIERVRSFQVAS